MSGQQWHASPALLAAYASGRAGAADAWSVEAHLAVCPVCRAELAVLVHRDDDGARGVLDRARQRVLDQVAVAPAPSRAGTGARGLLARAGLPWHLRWVVRPASLGAVALAVAAAVVFTGVTHLVVDPSGRAVWLLWALAPAVPVAGVALSGVGDGEDREAELATPSAGWRLVLWRSLVVVGAAVPMALLAGWVVSRVPSPAPPPGLAAATSLPVLWLLPALALTALTLAVGTWVVLPRAAALVGGAWALLVLPRAVVTRGGAPVEVVDGVVPGAAGLDRAQEVLQLIGASAQPVWLLLLVAALAVVVVRRESFGTVRPRLWTGPSGSTRGAGA